MQGIAEEEAQEESGWQMSRASHCTVDLDFYPKGRGEPGRSFKRRSEVLTFAFHKAGTGRKETTLVPPYLWVPCPQIQPIGLKILKKKNPESSEKQNEFVMCLAYLHSIYIVLGIISNLETI